MLFCFFSHCQAYLIATQGFLVSIPPKFAPLSTLPLLEYLLANYFCTCENIYTFSFPTCLPADGSVSPAQ